MLPLLFGYDWVRKQYFVSVFAELNSVSPLQLISMKFILSILCITHKIESLIGMTQ